MKSKKPNIALEDVADAVIQLRENDEKVTARNILPITGGSMSTVIRLLAQFLDDEALEEQFNTVGKDLLKALTKEMQVITDKKTKGLDKKVTCARKLRKEAIDILEKNERREAAQQEQWGQKETDLRVEIEALKTTQARTEGERNSLLHSFEELKQEHRQLIDETTKLNEDLAYIKGLNGYENNRIDKMAARIETETAPSPS